MIEAMAKAMEELYQIIGDGLYASAPAEWSSVFVSAKVTDDHAKTEYDYKDAAGLESWFDPGMAAHEKISMALIEMHQLMAASNATPWNRVRFELQSSGKFHIDFSYEEPADIFGS